MKKKKKILLFILLLVSLILIADGYETQYQDGPYVFKDSGKWVSITIKNDQIYKDTLIANHEGEYILDWSGNWANPVKLTNEFERPQTEYPLPKKFMVLSDMHGNLEGTIDLLTGSGVMDDRFNWQYHGWLIIDGDVFDRGEKVTECMWLIYHLWKQTLDDNFSAVIPIIGNHETMVLRQKVHKVKGKYEKTCELLEKTYNELYGSDSFLGSWVRSWQTVLKLGDFVILHGGISPGLAERYNNLGKINQSIYDYYQEQPVNQEEIAFLLSGNGPFWYRGYFYEEEKWEKSDPLIIQGVRQKYDIDKIIVGHTTMEGIRFFQKEQVIAIDAGLKYQEGGEALIWENGSFYVVTSSGTKRELKGKLKEQEVRE